MQEDSYKSPGGFIFGVQGWMWGPPKPLCITFYLDNTAKVSDQYGRPIKGAIIDGKEVRFAVGPPHPEDSTDYKRGDRKGLATHAQVIAALEHEKVDWQMLTYAGWPQISYAELKKVKQIPPTPIEELMKIRDPALRRDAVRLRKEMMDVEEQELKEMGLVVSEDEE